MTAISDDALFVAANTLMAGRMGSDFEWALAQAIDNMDHFARTMDAEITVPAHAPEPEVAQ